LGTTFVIFIFQTGQPAHSKSCGALTNNSGHPCLRLDVQAEEWKTGLS